MRVPLRVCVCARERERERESLDISALPQTKILKIRFRGIFFSERLLFCPIKFFDSLKMLRNRWTNFFLPRPRFELETFDSKPMSQPPRFDRQHDI